MKPEPFKIRAGFHPALRCRTVDALQRLDPIQSAKPNDIVAVSSRYKVYEKTRCNRAGMAQAWKITTDGVISISIFKTPKDHITPASVAMIHAEQDTILENMGMKLPERLGDSPFEDLGDDIDLICLNHGIIALRVLPDITRSTGDALFARRLPRIAAAYLPRELSREDLDQTILDLEVFLSLVFSTKPKTHIAMGKTDPVPKTNVTIIPPELI